MNKNKPDFNEESFKNGLMKLLDSGMMKPRELAEKILDMNKKNEIRKKYSSRIKERKRKDGGSQFYVCATHNKQLTGKTIELLWEKIFEWEQAQDISSYSMRELLPLWLKWKRDNTAVKGTTLRIILSDWEKYYENHDIIDQPLKDVKSKDITELYRSWTCKREITSYKFNNLKSILNGIYRYAISELEIVGSNPSKFIDMRQFPMKVVKHKTKTFSVDEKEILTEYLQNAQDGYDLAILFDFQLPLRIGELTALKWSDVHGDSIDVEKFQSRDTEMNDDLSFSDYKRVDTDHIKGYSEAGMRTLHLTPKALEILKRMREINPDGEYVFMHKGLPLSTNSFDRRLAKYCKKLNISEHKSHAIRFYVASCLYQNGVPLDKLRVMLGHTTSAMTLHYLRDVMGDDHTNDILDNVL